MRGQKNTLHWGNEKLLPMFKLKLWYQQSTAKNVQSILETAYSKFLGEHFSQQTEVFLRKIFLIKGLFRSFAFSKIQVHFGVILFWFPLFHSDSRWFD
jgi:hypothetical protein